MQLNMPSKWIAGAALTAAALLGAAAPAFAWHHGGPRVVFGFNVGPYWGPYWGPGWYYPPPYYYPPAVVVASPPAPQTYVERSDQPAPQAQQSYWYYCESSRGYYPYVKECPTGWKAVPPTPPAGQ